MKIVFLGGAGQRSSNCLEALIETKKNVRAVVLGKERRKNLDVSKIKSLGAGNKIPVVDDLSLNSAKGLDYVKQIKPDLIILCNYNPLLGDGFLAEFKDKVINLHGGKLPEYRGAYPRNWAIANGEKSGCCSIVKVNPDEFVDAGEVIAERPYTILDHETIKEVIEKDASVYPGLLIETIEKIEKEGKITGRLQEKGTYWHRRTKVDKLIKWNAMTSEQIRNLVRSETHPYEGAWTVYFPSGSEMEKEELEIKLFRVERTEGQNYKGIPGRIIKFPSKEPIVVCKEGSLEIKEIADENGKSLPTSFLKNNSYFIDSF